MTLQGPPKPSVDVRSGDRPRVIANKVLPIPVVPVTGEVRWVSWPWLTLKPETQLSRDRRQDWDGQMVLSLRGS